MDDHSYTGNDVSLSDTSVHRGDSLEGKLSSMTKEMNFISSTLKELHDKMNSRMDSFETDMYNIQSRMTEIRNPDPEVNFNFRPRVAEMVENVQSQNLNRNDSNLNNNQNMIGSSHITHEYNLKMKPQSFDGTADLTEYLTQFNLVAEINNWSYQAKALYLASSLTGNARSLLSELSEVQKRDFNSLVEILRARFGTKNKAEIFRSQLKSISRGKEQSLPELAQKIRKLTRQAYPDANSELIEILSLDHFVDSLDDADIRLRLRECCPKTMSEAETIAVRLETHKLVDKQRLQTVNAVNSSHREHTKSPLNEVLEKLANLTEKVEKLDTKKNDGNFKNNQNQGYFHSQRNNGRPNNGNNFFQNKNRYNQNQKQWSNNKRNDNQNNHGQNNVSSGNGNRSSWRTATRPNQH